MKIEKHLIIPNKLAYAQGKRPPVDCILCAVGEKDSRVDNLVVFQREGCFVTLNLYPYNPGHLMVVPVRHCEDLRELSDAEVLLLHRMQVFSIDVLEEVYRPGGFNVGVNIGKCSGASIAHLHLQIVPRYPVEVGFFDLFSDSRVIVEEPLVTRDKLQAVFAKRAPAFFSGG